MRLRERILIIERLDDLRHDMVTLLGEFEGYSVFHTDSGSEGLRLARIYHPSVVISDVNTIDMDGTAVLNALRSDPNLHKTPFIFLTTTNIKEIVARIGTPTNFEYLHKPFDVNELLTVMKTLIERGH